MLEVTLEEFYQIVGELEIVRRKQEQQLRNLLKQVDEMSIEIARLRDENGRLVETNNN
jgi:hypothetical protein